MWSLRATVSNLILLQIIKISYFTCNLWLLWDIYWNLNLWTEQVSSTVLGIDILN